MLWSSMHFVFASLTTQLFAYCQKPIRETLTERVCLGILWFIAIFQVIANNVQSAIATAALGRYVSFMLLDWVSHLLLHTPHSSSRCPFLPVVEVPYRIPVRLDLVLVLEIRLQAISGSSSCPRCTSMSLWPFSLASSPNAPGSSGTGRDGS